MHQQNNQGPPMEMDNYLRSSFLKRSLNTPIGIRRLYSEMSKNQIIPKDLQLLGEREYYYHYLMAQKLAQSCAILSATSESEKDYFTSVFNNDLAIAHYKQAVLAWFSDQSDTLSAESQLCYGAAIGPYQRSFSAYALFISGYSPMFLPNYVEYHRWQDVCKGIAKEMYNAIPLSMKKECEQITVDFLEERYAAIT